MFANSAEFQRPSRLTVILTLNSWSSGGGWTLVVSISSKNNDHLQRKVNNCANSILCVPFAEQNIIARKLSDEDIHKLAQTEGNDMWENQNDLIKWSNQILRRPLLSHSKPLYLISAKVLPISSVIFTYEWYNSQFLSLFYLCFKTSPAVQPLILK